MPFVSEKQRKYLWSQKPEVAKQFVKHSPADYARAIRSSGNARRKPT